MSLIVYTVKASLNRWAIMHNDVAMATFSTRGEAERAALAVAVRHPAQASAELDLIREDGEMTEIRIF